MLQKIDPLDFRTNQLLLTQKTDQEISISLGPDEHYIVHDQLFPVILCQIGCGFAHSTPPKQKITAPASVFGADCMVIFMTHYFRQLQLTHMIVPYGPTAVKYAYERSIS
jgi:hypothetical protein